MMETRAFFLNRLDILGFGKVFDELDRDACESPHEIIEAE